MVASGGAGWQVWTTAEVITLAHQQNLLQDQVVMVYADAATRDGGSGITDQTAGMMSYLTTPKTLHAYDGTGWVEVVTEYSGSAQNITTTDESSDTTAYPVFVNATTGDQIPHTGSNLWFNSSTGTLTATAFAGSLTGNASTATKWAATKSIDITGVTAAAQNFDGSANISIPVTAVPASLITAGALGAGAYTGLTSLTSTSFLRGGTGTAAAPSLRCGDSNSGFYGGNSEIIGSVDSTNEFRVLSGSVGPHPDKDNATNLGTTGARFTNLYATNTTIQTSDERAKSFVGDSLGLEFVNRLSARRGRWLGSDDRRVHQWLSAQNIASALTDSGLDPAETFLWHQANPEDSDMEAAPIPDLQMVAYGEMIPVLVRSTQELSDKLDAMAQRLDRIGA